MDSQYRDLLLCNRNIFPDPEFTWHHCGYFQTAGAQEGGFEFNRSVRDCNVIRSGRLWTEHRGSHIYMLDGTVRDPVQKAAYDKWGSELFRWIRKRYIKYSQMFYIGPGAARFQEMGGRLGGAYPEMDNPNNIEQRPF